MKEFDIGISIVVAAILIALILLGVYTNRKRRIFLNGVAQEWGMRFFAKDSEKRLPYLLGKFRFFQGTQGHKARNLIAGEQQGVQYLIGDIFYTLPNPNRPNKTVGRHRTVLIAEMGASPSVPAFCLRPERPFVRAIKGYNELPDLDFEEDPSFSEAYKLMGEEEEAIRKLFSGPVRAYFSQEKGLTVEVQDGYLFVFRHQKLLEEDAQAYQELKQLGEEIAGLLSRHAKP